MEAAGALIAERPDLHVQTHLSENRAECDVRALAVPVRRRTTPTIYERYGFIGPEVAVRALRPPVGPRGRRAGRDRIGRGVQPDLEPVPRQRPRSISPGCTRLGVRTARRHRRRRAAPATRCCAPWTRRYKVLAAAGPEAQPADVLLQMTLGNARALGLDAHIGALVPGADADLVVLDSRATPAMALRSETGAHPRRGAVHPADDGRRPLGGRNLRCRGRPRARRADAASFPRSEPPRSRCLRPI